MRVSRHPSRLVLAVVLVVDVSFCGRQGWLLWGWPNEVEQSRPSNPRVPLLYPGYIQGTPRHLHAPPAARKQTPDCHARSRGKVGGCRPPVCKPTLQNRASLAQTLFARSTSTRSSITIRPRCGRPPVADSILLTRPGSS